MTQMNFKGIILNERSPFEKCMYCNDIHMAFSNRLNFSCGEEISSCKEIGA